MKQRIFKFRAWHFTQKRMIPFEQLIVALKNINVPNNTWHYMQFIGKTDSNNEELYEGDRIIFGSDPTEYIISWISDGWMAYNKNAGIQFKPLLTEKDNIPFQSYRRIKKVGHIYDKEKGSN